METLWIHKYSSLNECFQVIFPSQFQFMPTNIKKSRNFYEAILIKLDKPSLPILQTLKSPNKLIFQKLIFKGYCYMKTGNNTH